MPDLETLLREVRPAPDPAWTAKLDSRVAARFPGPPPRWKAPLNALREHFLAFGAVATVACGLIVLVIALPSVNTSGGDSATTSGSAGTSAESNSADVPAAATAAPESAKRESGASADLESRSGGSAP